MSRIGKKPIAIPAGVKFAVADRVVSVEGPKGKLSLTLPPYVDAAAEGTNIVVTTADETREANAMHGLARSLINNMVVGVTAGFTKELEIQGVGYRAAKEGKNLVMNLGYSHQVTVPEIDGITIEVPSQTRIVIKGADKEKVGQFAADVREKRPPENYKGKGIRYVGENVRIKEGKTGK
jgi:large subunit ribosomal protein L6